MTRPSMKMIVQQRTETVRNIEAETSEEALLIISALGKVASRHLVDDSSLSYVALEVQAGFIDQINQPDQVYPLVLTINDQERIRVLGGITAKGERTDLQSQALTEAVSTYIPEHNISFVRASSA